MLKFMEKKPFQFIKHFKYFRYSDKQCTIYQNPKTSFSVRHERFKTRTNLP